MKKEPGGVTQGHSQKFSVSHFVPLLYILGLVFFSLRWEAGMRQSVKGAVRQSHD